MENITQKHSISQIIRKGIVVAFWIGFLLICFINRERITVDGIVNMTSENQIITAIILLICFAIKSVSIFIYGGILYAASAILFPLPIAIAINIVGTIIMSSIPYFIGQKAGGKAAMTLVEKHPKLGVVMDIQNQNDIFICFFSRMIGLLPSDLLSMYLGASGIPYNRYFIGTLAGRLPSTILFSIMGMSIDDPSSPAFIVSLCVELGLMLVSALLFFMMRSKKKGAKTENIQ